MLPKTAKEKQTQVSLEKARQAKRRRALSESSFETAEIEQERDVEVVDFTDLLTMSEDALDTENEEIDPTFDLDASIKPKSAYLIETFCDDWISQLDWDDVVSLSLFLAFLLASHLGIGETKAAEFASAMRGKSEKTIRE